MFKAPSPNGNGAAALVPAAPAEVKSGVGLDPGITFAGPAARIVYLDGSQSGDAARVSRATAYAAALYAYVAMRYRAENFAQAPLVVVEETDDGEEIIDHPLDLILREPSPDLDMGELLELTQLYEDRDGQALWVKDANLAGSTGRLTPFAGRDFTVRQTADRMFGAFDLDTAKGKKTLAPEAVVFFHYLNPGNAQAGLSPLDAALSWLNLGARTTATVRKLLENAVFPSIVISTDKDWHPDPDEYQRYVDLLNQFHAGTDNVGKPFVNLGGGTVDRVSFTLQELLPSELLDRIEACVAAAFRIPPVVLGFLVGLKNSPWSQMEQAHQQAHTDALVPLWKRKARALTRQLLRPVDDNPKRHIRFDLSGIAALQDDESKKVTDAVNAKYWTLNERRIYTGQESLPEGDERGDWIEAMAVGPMVGGWGEAPPVASFGAPAPTDPSKTRAKRAPHDPSWKWSRFDLLTKAQEDTWARTTVRLLKADRDAVVDLVNRSAFETAWAEALGKSTQPAEVKSPPEIDPNVLRDLIAALEDALDTSTWLSEVTPLVESTAKHAIRDAAREIGVRFDLLSPALEGYTKGEAAWLVRGIDSTTRDRIATDLAAGLRAGEGIPDLTKRLKDSAAFSQERAELVARTETTRVTNGAQRESLSKYQRDNAVRIEKGWLSARDGDVRPEHRELDDGKWIGVDQTFGNGLTEPGEPNCRCTLIYRVAEENA